MIDSSSASMYKWLSADRTRPPLLRLEDVVAKYPRTTSFDHAGFHLQAFQSYILRSKILKMPPDLSFASSLGKKCTSVVT